MPKKSLIFCLPFLAIALSQPAMALPLEGRVGILGMTMPNYAGIEGELGLKGTPFRIGGTVLPLSDSTGSPSNQQAFSFWGSYTQQLSPNVSLGLFLGANSFPFHLFARLLPGASGEIPENQRLGLLAGASCTLRHEQYWLRFSPNSVFFRGTDGLFPTGIPMLAVGARVAPSLDLSLRLDLMPVALSWEF